jgi:phenylacetate-CoA ligase
MPLIRYDIGDLGVFVEEKTECKCGVTYPKIKKVVGRTTDFFKNKKGDKIDGEYFTHLLYFLPEVNRFQIIQEDFMNIIIKIQGVKGSISHEKTLDIIQKVRLVMGDDCIVSFSYVNEIEKTKTGKFLYTISKLNS